MNTSCPLLEQLEDWDRERPPVIFSCPRSEGGEEIVGELLLPPRGEDVVVSDFREYDEPWGLREIPLRREVRHGFEVWVIEEDEIPGGVMLAGCKKRRFGVRRWVLDR